MTGSEADVASGLFNLLTNVDGAKEETAVQFRPAGNEQSAGTCRLPVALSRR